MAGENLRAIEDGLCSVYTDEHGVMVVVQHKGEHCLAITQQLEAFLALFGLSVRC